MVSRNSVPADTLELIYDAALEPALWQKVLHDVAQKTGGEKGALILQNQFTGQGDAVLANIDPAAIEEFFGYFATRNPMQQNNLKAFQKNSPPQLGVFTDQEVMARSELARTEYYNDFMRRFGMESTLMIGLAFDGTDGTSIAITRPPSREDFGQSEIELAGALQRHFIRALKIGEKLNSAQLVGNALGDVLQKSGHGIFLTDAKGRIRYANETANEIVARNDGLSGKDSMLAATSRAHAKQLEAILAAAAAPERAQRTGGSMLLPRLSRQHPLSVIAVPLNAEMGAPFHNGPLALVCVVDPDRDATLPQQHLIRDLFDFTPAETRVAMELLAAEEPKAIAQHLNLSVNTVRVHMASIFRKTHTSRQAELVRLLMQMTAVNLG
ncbi:MAG TPA: helix-turn-helix transcriptional regulator [Rhizomicrobium sp.]|nr:helix-turn-helix transcriptional regulator [Rhizomicrobium sp.]